MVLYTVYSTERRHNILTGSRRAAILIVYHSSVHGFKRGGAGHAVGCGWLFSSRLRLWGSHCQYNVARRCPPLRLIWFFAGGCRADAPPPAALFNPSGSAAYYAAAPLRGCAAQVPPALALAAPPVIQWGNVAGRLVRVGVAVSSWGAGAVRGLLQPTSGGCRRVVVFARSAYAACGGWTRSRSPVPPPPSAGETVPR